MRAAKDGNTIESISGSDRAMMYVLAAWTGCRKGEIGSLTLKSFDLESDTPTATVQARTEGREDDAEGPRTRSTDVDGRGWSDILTYQNGKGLFADFHANRS